jgi:hypothetical protein
MLLLYMFTRIIIIIIWSVYPQDQPEEAPFYCSTLYEMWLNCSTLQRLDYGMAYSTKAGKVGEKKRKEEERRRENVPLKHSIVISLFAILAVAFFAFFALRIR